MVEEAISLVRLLSFCLKQVMACVRIQYVNIIFSPYD